MIYLTQFSTISEHLRKVVNYWS